MPDLAHVEVSVIAAVSANGVIGVDGALPWHLPDDLKRFKALTCGRALIMGRKTFESIGRPLPERVNIVLSRNRSYDAPGVSVAHCWEQALALAAEVGDQVFVIGGADVYTLALPFTRHLYLTRVLTEIQGDAYFPVVDFAQWHRLAAEEHRSDDRHRVAYTFEQHQRLPAGAPLVPRPHRRAAARTSESADPRTPAARL